MAMFPKTSRMLDTGVGADELIQAGPQFGIGRNGLNQSGYQWTNVSTQSGQSFCQRIGNKIVYSGSAANGNSNISWMFPPDQEAQIRIDALQGAGNTLFIFLRIQNPGTAQLNAYFFGFTDGAPQTYTVGGLVNDGFLATIGSGNITGGNLAAGDAFGGQVINNVLSFWVRRGGVWTQIGSDFTNAQVVGSGQIGFETQGALTLFQGSDLIGGASLEDQVTGDYSRYPKQKLRKAA
jgi:hypothetical protein